ncbi:hypothetical protein [Subtercola endophyticus]|nr:hypothetical protein [Subtercola endophyticus]
MTEQGEGPQRRFRAPRYLPQLLTIGVFVLAAVVAYLLLEMR